MQPLKEKHLGACTIRDLSNQPRISKNVKDAIGCTQELPIPFSGVELMEEKFHAMSVKAGIPKPNVRSDFFLAKLGQINSSSVGWAILEPNNVVNQRRNN